MSAGPAPSPPKPSKSKFGPDSEEWNKLKGQEVRVTYKNGAHEVGKLAWVDFYSFGWDNSGIREIVYKHDVRKVSGV